MDLKAIIVERGIELLKGKGNKWYVQSVPQNIHPAPIDPKLIILSHKLRPILFKYEFKTGGEISLLVPYPGQTTTKKYLDIEHSNLLQREWIFEIKLILQDIFDVSYIVGATIYHCKRLAQIYSDICRSFSKFPTNFQNLSHKSSYGNQSEAYYEFDALITAARRAYDTTRYILWKAFGPKKGSIPSSFKKTLPLCRNIPDELRMRLENSWDQYGEQITNYRDCIQHYVPIEFGGSSACMTKLDDSMWSVSLLIPDNPEVKSKKMLKYTSNIDALTYGWQVATEIIDITCEILNFLPRTKEIKG